MQQRLLVDGDIFENAPRVNADISYTDKKAFNNIRIRVDEALGEGMGSEKIRTTNEKSLYFLHKSPLQTFK